jgi:hypothetical protein
VWLGDSSYSVQWAYALTSWAYTTAMIVALSSGVIMLMEGAPGSALVFATLATAISLPGWSRNQTARRGVVGVRKVKAGLIHAGKALEPRHVPGRQDGA